MFFSSYILLHLLPHLDAILQIESFMKKIPQKLLSTAAFACHNYTRSLRHLECHIREQVRAARDNKSGSQSDQFAVIQKEIPSLQEIYAKLDEPDNVWGALDIRKQMREPSYREHILAYESTGNFTEALPFHDLAAKAHPENVSEQKAQINCLLKLNQPFIAFNCVGKIMETNPEWQEQLIAHRMEAAWKLQDWKGLENSLPKTESFTITNNWDVTIGQLLLGIHNRQATEVQKKLSVAREKLIAGFSTANMEGNAYERAYMYVCRMHSVTEIEQFVRCQMEGKRESTALTPETLLAIWRDRQKLVQRSSTMLEPILEMRRTLLGLSGNSSGDFYKRETAYLWLQSAKMARKAGHLQSAWSYLTNAKEFRLPETFVEEAKLYRLKGQSERAIDTLTSGIREFYSPIEKLQGLKSQEGKKTLKSFAKAQLLLAEYSKDAAAGDFDGVSVLYQKAFSACPDSESTQYAVATFLDGDSWRRNSDQLNIVTVVRRYAGSLEFGSQHLHHSMPRLLTLWLDFTTALHSDQVKKLATKSRSSVSTGKLEESKEVPGVSPLIRTLNKELELLLQRGPLYYFYTALSQMLSRLCHPNDEVAATLIVREARLSR